MSASTQLDWKFGPEGLEVVDQDIPVWAMFLDNTLSATLYFPEQLLGAYSDNYVWAKIPEVSDADLDRAEAILVASSTST